MENLRRISCTVCFCSIFTLTHAWGEEYRAADDATVIPIVLPIVGVVMLACIVGCCVQGRECSCFKKDDDKDDPKKKELEGNTLGRQQRVSDFVLENEKSAYSSKSSTSSYRVGQLPGYSTGAARISSCNPNTNNHGRGARSSTPYGLPNNYKVAPHKTRSASVSSHPQYSRMQQQRANNF
nr:uncharacterized protein LOC100175220 [Ciona intestinalis]|eukprot:XP_002124579.1 uncharacterized protein LOC100175220 [Ciona intestinalis]